VRMVETLCDRGFHNSLQSRSLHRSMGEKHREGSGSHEGPEEVVSAMSS
jgi:hypothetical protein